MEDFWKSCTVVIWFSTTKVFHYPQSLWFWESHSPNRRLDIATPSPYENSGREFSRLSKLSPRSIIFPPPTFHPGRLQTRKAQEAWTQYFFSPKWHLGIWSHVIHLHSLGHKTDCNVTDDWIHCAFWGIYARGMDEWLLKGSSEPAQQVSVVAMCWSILSNDSLAPYFPSSINPYLRKNHHQVK